MNRLLGLCIVLALCGCGHMVSGYADVTGVDFTPAPEQTYSFTGTFDTKDSGLIDYIQTGAKLTARHRSYNCPGEGTVTGNVATYTFSGPMCSGTAVDTMSSDGTYIKSDWISLGMTGTSYRKRMGNPERVGGFAAVPPPVPEAKGESGKTAVVGMSLGNLSGVNKTALVIGNGAYHDSPLANPVNDATDIASALSKLGFTVIFRKNAGLKDMESAIDEFYQRLRGGGVGLFYFAGHGIQAMGVNYLIPVDAVLKSESDVKYKAVDAGRVLGKMEDAGNQLNIVILDACRNNPFARAFRSYTKGLAQMDAPAGSFIAYATAPGSTAADGSGRNGVYTKHLLRNMIEPGVPVEEVFKRVRIGVAAETDKAQIPWEASSLTGNFYFTTP